LPAEERPVTEAEGKARNKAVVTQFFERMNAGDLDGSFVLLADDCTFNDTFHAREFFSLNEAGRIPDRRS
jgi:hypothetical protein